MTDMNEPVRVLLSVREVAERLGISVRTVWRWTRSGELPAPVRRGRRIVRWKAVDIDQYVRDLPVQPRWHLSIRRP